MKKRETCNHETDVEYGALETIDGYPQYSVVCRGCGSSGVILLEEGENIWDKE